MRREAPLLPSGYRYRRPVLDNLAPWAAAVMVAVAFLAAVGLGLIIARQRAGSDPGRVAGRRNRPHRDTFRPDGDDPEPEPLKRAAVIVNPTKFGDLEAVRRRITDTCFELGWGEPIWLETTAAQPGTQQALRAVEDGAVVVCPLGGDGTVRAVAAAVVGTETPLGLLPGGTGNLLARNLDLPLDSIDRALRVALTGQNKRVDVGRLTVRRSSLDELPEEHIFLVMAGLGFDAAIMAGAAEALKAKVGSAAYVVSGFRNLAGPQFKVKVKFDGEMEFTRRTRTVVIGNCGRVLGGLVLMPAARIDDGALDTVLLSPKGVVGWVSVAGRVISRRHQGHAMIDRHTGQEVRVRADRPQEVQIDGDTIGPALGIAATVDPLALTVRVGPAS